MGHRSKQAAIEYGKAYRQAVKEGKIVPKPASKRREENTICCSSCGCQFYRPIANRTRCKSGQYCSRSCMAKAFIGRESCRKLRAISKPCTQCGKQIDRPPWHAKQSENAFCNRKCFANWKSQHWKAENNPAWVGGRQYYYGPNWKRQSREARRRDNHTCQLCGITQISIRRALDVHHIKPFRFFGLDNYKTANCINNLISLCGTCHTTVEPLCKHGKFDSWSELETAAKNRINPL